MASEEVIRLDRRNVISASKNGARVMAVVITIGADDKKTSATKHLHKVGNAYRDAAGKLYELV